MRTQAGHAGQERSASWPTAQFKNSQPVMSSFRAAFVFSSSSSLACGPRLDQADDNELIVAVCLKKVVRLALWRLLIVRQHYCQAAAHAPAIVQLRAHDGASASFRAPYAPVRTATLCPSAQPGRFACARNNAPESIGTSASCRRSRQPTQRPRKLRPNTPQHASHTAIWAMTPERSA